MKILKLPAALIAAACLTSGCATPQQTTLADGSVAYRIDCDGTSRGLNACLERAGRSCGAAGYVLIGDNGKRLSSASNDSQALFKDFAGDRNSILFQCDADS
ncbi:MAG: hypothetical protein AAF290_14025 [Pseudomonadota bacterium]